MSTSQATPTANENRVHASRLVENARRSLQRGERLTARRYAEQAASLAPELEDPWLLLAALASPRASIAYLERALEINPSSMRARKGMEWASQRLKPGASPLPVVEPAPLRPVEVQAPIEAPSTPPAIPSEPIITAVREIQPVPTAPASRTTVYRVPSETHRVRTPIPLVFWYAFGTLFFSLVFLSASLIPFYSQMQVSLPADLAAYLPELSIAAPLLQPGITTEIPVPISSPVPGGETAFQPSATQEPVPTFLPTETPFLPPTDTPTLAPSPTPLPTETPMPSPTPTLEPTPMPSATLAPASATPLPQPTRKPKKKAAAASPSFRPENVQVNDRWVDVDLSSQTTYAMEGNQVMRSFIVSTGRYPTVTVTGAYKIYVKYRTANMSGDDYFLPNVPYVMYFFKGYGLHGTYWHNNFGTPMSHGCVNFRPEDAAWLFDFASVGTIVNVHP